MTNPNMNNSTEAELESFRQKWRDEVSAKSKATGSTSSGVSKSSQAPQSHTREVPKHIRHYSVEEPDGEQPHVYPDLGGKQHGHHLNGTEDQVPAPKDPETALEHYEQAVEKESQGSLGDSVNLYRKAFRLDPEIHKVYKNKHFPPSYFKSAAKAKAQALPQNQIQDPNPSNASVTVPNTAHHSLHGLPASLQSMIDEFSSISIQGEAPPTELSPSPPCPIATIPEELLAEILVHVAVQDVASFVRLSQVCKRLAYLIMTEDSVWKRVALGPEFGFDAMHYSFACQIGGEPLGDDGEGGQILGPDEITEDDGSSIVPTEVTALMVPSVYPSYRAMFQRRPRVRFNGCYISTVNYTRPGASSPDSISWNSPIHIVTYYRYLRFLRDGTCLSLLSTSEPPDVVPFMHKENLHKNHGNLPGAPMKDAVVGRWRMTGPGVSEEMECEREGSLVIETAGATPKYMYQMNLGFGSAGRGARNNRLSWQRYWCYNRLTDDWGEFSLKNDKPFYWSRVKSYGNGLSAGLDA